MTFKGLCHTCYSSNMDLEFDNNMKPICKNCVDKNHSQTKEQHKLYYRKLQEELQQMKQTHPELIDE